MLEPRRMDRRVQSRRSRKAVDPGDASASSGAADGSQPLLTLADVLRPTEFGPPPPHPFDIKHRWDLHDGDAEADADADADDILRRLDHCWKSWTRPQRMLLVLAVEAFVDAERAKAGWNPKEDHGTHVTMRRVCKLGLEAAQLARDIAQRMLDEPISANQVERSRPGAS